jgi:hypothetical protein
MYSKSARERTPSVSKVNTFNVDVENYNKKICRKL